mmetsp:Transcript_27252/g.40678  ORF Transcript_27252/g.40678 Transcript_27252/m.40678 type:complete len:260 (-) Transcript_27252:148-927(-)
MSQNDDNAGVGDGLSARQGGQEISTCEHHQKQRCWFGMKCICPHSLEIEEIERAKRCQRRFELKKKGGKRWQRSNPRILSMRFNSLEATVHNAIEGMREELQAVRVAVTEEDRFKKLEAENKRLECENALLKEEKLQKDEELEKVRDKLGELEAKNKELTDSLSLTQQELTDSLSLTQQQKAECQTKMSELEAELVATRCRVIDLRVESEQYQKKTWELGNQWSYAEQHLCDECHSMMGKAMENYSGIDWSKPVPKLVH